jgi:iron complex transport system substrate-binding protein
MTGSMKYKRIVSLAPSITETIFALNQGHRLVGITDHCNFPEGTNSKTRIGGFSNPDVEIILKLQPDLILATGLHRPEKLAVFQEKNIDIKAVRAEKLNDSFQVIRQISEYLEVAEEANLLASKVHEEFEKQVKRTICLQPLKVCYFCSFDPLCGWKNKCQVNELIRLVGCEPIPFNPEQVAESIHKANPDLILIPETNSGQKAAKLREIIDSNPLIRQTKAFRNKQVRNVDGVLLSRPGPRAAEGLHLFVEAIFPELKNKNQDT